MKPISIAVVGVGYWGPNLLRNFSRIPEADMNAGCDIDETKLQYAKSRFPQIKVTTNYRELFDDPSIDAVAISTPLATHFQLAKEALERGKHVLVEKPLAQTSKEAEELIKLASGKGKILMVGHTFEYSPPVNKIKELISSGEIGKIYYIDSSRVNLGLFRSDTSVIWDLAAHDVSILLYLLDAKPRSVLATGQGFIQNEIEDVAYLNIRFDNGTMANVHVSWLSPCKLRRITIVGDKKMIVYDDAEDMEKVKMYDRGVSLVKLEDIYKGFPIIYRTGDIHIPYIETTESLEIECRHFLECIRDNKKPRSSGEVGLAVVKVLEAAEKSLVNRGAQEVLL